MLFNTEVWADPSLIHFKQDTVIPQTPPLSK